jgi:hypothetical protein
MTLGNELLKMSLAILDSAEVVRLDLAEGNRKEIKP